MKTSLNRREFLKVSGAAASAIALPGKPFAMAGPGPAGKTRHVLLVAFAGGVRSRDKIGTPANVPNLMRLAEKGVVFPNCGIQNTGHYGATLSIFTGVTEYMGIRENERGYNPTLFEYLREGLTLPASKVWLSTNNGAQGVNFAYSLNRKFGPSYGANVIDGEGLFNEEFREVLQQFGRPKTDSEQETQALEKLRKSIRSNHSGAALNDAETAARVEKYILDELTGNDTTRMTGPAAGDAKALNIAGKILQLFRPTFLGVSLSNADIAHGSYNAYVDVIRRNDQEVGGILVVVERDTELRESTAIFVLPEFGRDRDLNQRNGLDHGDGSPELQKVACIAYGPDFRQGRVVDSDVSSIDVCPTICKLFSVEPEQSKGKVLPKLFV